MQRQRLHILFKSKILLAGLAGAALLAGCGQPQEPPQPAAPPPTSERPATPPGSSGAAPGITLTQADADRAVTLSRGQVVEIRLPAERTEGLAWIPAQNLLPTMSTDGVPQFDDDTGTEIWRFVGLEPGHAHLVFEYRLMSDPNAPPRETVTYHFDVE
jgi:predicted secreted protein